MCSWSAWRWCPYTMGLHRQSHLQIFLSTLGVRLPVLSLAFECTAVLSLGNMLTGDLSLPAYSWTQKASTASRAQLEVPGSCCSGRCAHQVHTAPAGSKREQHVCRVPSGTARSLCSLPGPHGSGWHNHFAFLSYTAGQSLR